MDKSETLATPCLMFPVLPVSLACPFLMATSVISNVYLSCVMDKPETLATPDTQDTGQKNVRDN
jgi:hypothetical protein